MTRDAFEAAFASNRSKLFRKARSFGMSRDDAEDAVQLTALKAWRNIGSYRGEYSFIGWLTTILTNTARDAARSRRATCELTVEPSVEPGWSAIDPALQAALRRLTPEEVEVATAFTQHANQKDAAASLGVSTTAYKSRLNRMRAKVSQKASPKEVALYVKGGASVVDACHTFGICRTTLFKYCSMHGVSARRPRKAKSYYRERKNAWAKEKYRTDPAYRAAQKARTKSRRDPETDSEKTKAWRRVNRDRYNARRRRLRRLYAADGYDPNILHGDSVKTTWGKEYRVVKRYALDGEAVCDLDDGKAVITQVPMSSLTLVPEKGTKTY